MSRTMKEPETLRSAHLDLAGARFALDVEHSIRVVIASCDRARRLVQATEAAAARPIRVINGGVL